MIGVDLERVVERLSDERICIGYGVDGFLRCYDCGELATRIDIQHNSDTPELQTQFVWCEDCYKYQTT